jgi:hypothetical protein|tara:strand:+ start:320 stop:526 length:207 start_codon:yes stop_codon:yes gene_type:complete
MGSSYLIALKSTNIVISMVALSALKWAIFLDVLSFLIVKNRWGCRDKIGLLPVIVEPPLQLWELFDLM